MPTIRLAREADAPAIAAIYGPYCNETVISFEDAGPAAEEMARRIRTIAARHPWIVHEEPRAALGEGGPASERRGAGVGAPRQIEDGGDVVGYAYASPHHERSAYRWSVSTAIYINRAYHRRGAGRALYTTLFELLRHLGYFTATAGITLPNPASVGLHEAFGFTLVGVYRDIGHKMGDWHDVAWYQRVIQRAMANPLEPRPLKTIDGTPEWHDAVAQGLALYGQHTR
jgi:phosphinothricin acetyltransferase